MEVHEDATKVAARAAFRGLLQTPIGCAAMSRCTRSIRMAAPVQVMQNNSGQAQVGRHVGLTAGILLFFAARENAHKQADVKIGRRARF